MPSKNLGILRFSLLTLHRFQRTFLKREISFWTLAIIFSCVHYRCWFPKYLSYSGPVWKNLKLFWDKIGAPIVKYTYFKKSEILQLYYGNRPIKLDFACSFHWRSKMRNAQSFREQFFLKGRIEFITLGKVGGSLFSDWRANSWETRGAGFRLCIPTTACLTACFWTSSYLFFN